jgi:hypothetical protein
MSGPEPQRQILTWDEDALVRQVGRALIDRGMGQGMSLLASGHEVCIPRTVGGLYELYNERPEPGAGS